MISKDCTCSKTLLPGFLTRTKRSYQITPIPTAVHLSLLRFGIDFKILLLIFLPLNGLAPAYFVWFPYSPWAWSLLSLSRLLSYGFQQCKFTFFCLMFFIIATNCNVFSESAFDHEMLILTGYPENTEALYANVKSKLSAHKQHIITFTLPFYVSMFPFLLNFPPFSLHIVDFLSTITTKFHTWRS